MVSNQDVEHGGVKTVVNAARAVVMAVADISQAGASGEPSSSSLVPGYNGCAHASPHNIHEAITEPHAGNGVKFIHVVVTRLDLCLSVRGVE